MRRGGLAVSGPNALGSIFLVLLAAASLIVVTSVPANAYAPRVKKPGAPTAVIATPVNGGSAVSWMAPASDGGLPITAYTVTASHGGQTCTTTGAVTCTVAGLTNGHLYKIKVRASNAKGEGPAARVQVTPSNAQNCSYIGPDANLQHCDLAGADLETNLSGANLSDTDLETTFLTGANLTGANLTGAYLYLAYMNDATLTDANLTAADLNLTNLTGVVSGGIIGTPAVFPEDWSLVDGYLVGPLANLTGANLTDADLSSADLGYSTLADANLSGADLSGVDLNRVISGGIIGTPSALPSGWLLVDGYLIGQGANLNDANLNGANLTDADLELTELIGATLANANLSGADLSSADLYDVASGGITGTPSAFPNDGWSIINGYLVGPGANLTDADLSGVDLSGVDLTTGNLTGANLSGANLSGVIWSDTICPDGTNSNSDGDTCVNNLG
jgi:uncharacterized protein YjbI with pentapeptide repeats